MKRPRFRGALLLVPVLLAWPAAPARSDDIASKILAEEQNQELRVVGLTRFRLSYPQRASASLGAIFVHQPVSYDCRTVCTFRGPFVALEPGYSGGQLSVGYGSLSGETGRGGRFLTRYYLGYGVRAALLRTWNGADLDPPGQTRAGVEAELSIIGVNFSIGLFHPVGSSDADDAWVWTGGVGWGF